MRRFQWTAAHLYVSQKMKTMPSLVFLLFLSLFFVIGFGILGYGLFTLRASKLAKDWPTVHGKITACELKESNDSESTTYKTIVKYNYTVDNRIYEGDRIAFGYSGSSGHSAHKAVSYTHLTLPTNREV